MFQVNTNSSLYPKKFIEKTLEEMPGGVHIVLEGIHGEGWKVIAMGYRYSVKKLFSLFSHQVLDQQDKALHMR